MASGVAALHVAPRDLVELFLLARWAYCELEAPLFPHVYLIFFLLLFPYSYFYDEVTDIEPAGKIALVVVIDLFRVFVEPWVSLPR